jgi:hypothetical protein
VSDEALVLVGGVVRADTVHEQPVELGRDDSVEHQLAEVRQAAVAEVAVAVDLE